MDTRIKFHLVKFGRLTPAREEVADLLLKHGCLSAYELLDKMPGAKPPTVYRALEFLEKAGVVHKVASKSRYKFCSDFDKPHTPQFWHCGQCERIDELALPVIDSQHPDFAHAHPSSHVAEVQGCCRKCHD